MLNSKRKSAEAKPIFPSAPFLYPLKISENLMVSWCFHGLEKGCIGNEWVNFTKTEYEGTLSNV